MVQLHRLEGFYRVALARGYARAARQFPYPITQPAVHQQVRKLEQELGARLFERVAKDQLRLTAAGRRLFAFCEPYFAELPEVVRAIAAGRYGGVLRIDAAGLVLRRLMPGWIQRLRRARPDVAVELGEIARPDLGRLRSGETDLIVDYLPDHAPDVRSRVVGRCYSFLVAPAVHPACAKKRRANEVLRALAGESFVGYPSGLPHHELQSRALAGAGVRPERMLSASSADSILGFVAAGLGYSLVPWLDRAGPRVRGVAVFPVGAAGRFPIAAAWLAHAQPNPLLEAALAVAPEAPNRVG